MDQQLAVDEAGLGVVAVDDSARDTVLLAETDHAAFNTGLREVRISLRRKDLVAIPIAARLVWRRGEGGRHCGRQHAGAADEWYAGEIVAVVVEVLVRSVVLVAVVRVVVEVHSRGGAVHVDVDVTVVVCVPVTRCEHAEEIDGSKQLLRAGGIAGWTWLDGVARAGAAARLSIDGLGLLLGA